MMRIVSGLYISHKFRKEEKTVKVTFIDTNVGKVYFKHINNSSKVVLPFSDSFWFLDNVKLSRNPIYAVINIFNYYIRPFSYYFFPKITYRAKGKK